jgi:hypothetical protein
MLGPKITDPEILKEIEASRLEDAKRGGFYDPDLDAILTQQEQEPGFWEEMAEFAERHWPSKKPEAAEPENTPGTAPES